MRLASRTFVVALSFFFGVCAIGILNAQEEDAKKKEIKKDISSEQEKTGEQQDKISPAKIRSSRLLSDAEASASVRNSILKSKGAKALSAKLSQLGFEEEKEQVFGQTGVLEHGNNTMTVEVVLQDYTKPGSKDKAALGFAKVVSKDGEAVYEFFLLAPNGDPRRSKEFTVDKAAKVLETHSWWTCLQGKFREAGGACAAAVGDCWMAGKCKDKGWTCWLACVGVPCGWAWIKVTACCTCNCKLWNRAWCGCCRQ